MNGRDLFDELFSGVQHLPAERQHRLGDAVKQLGRGKAAHQQFHSADAEHRQKQKPYDVYFFAKTGFARQIQHLNWKNPSQGIILIL